MGVTAAVRQAALALGADVRIARAVVGGIYAAVQLEGGTAGVAYRFPEAEGCPRRDEAPRTGAPSRRTHASRRAGAWTGRAARELVPLLGSDDRLHSALALAAVNALCGAGAASAGEALPGDVLDHLELRDGERVCMVGCFLPLLTRLQGRKVEVLSVDERPVPGALPAEQVETLLPSSQVALITATALVNATLERLLELARGCRTVALLGPSTPMLPPAFSGTAVRLLSGIWIRDPEAVLEIVGAGGGFRDFRAHVVKQNIRV